MADIKIYMDERGIVEGAFVSPELADSQVTLIDFVSDALERLDEAQKQLDDAERQVKEGRLVWIEATR